MDGESLSVDLSRTVSAAGHQGGISAQPVRPSDRAMFRFVIQEHQARTHHFDFRLEKDGMFKSWAVPKGLPEQPGIKRLAIRVEDHELSFGDFEGQIPQDQYGAGQVRVWDKGTYDSEEWTDQRIVFTLYGAQASGRFNLIRFNHGKPNEWLIIKRS